jgi:YidC/Oxa1 family membrane protein insertase
MSALLGVPVDAAYHLVSALANVLSPVLGGFAAVAGIIVFTLAVRLAVTPLTFRALRGQAAQARLAPHVRRLRERYGKQPERFQRELTALHAREGTSVFAGFGPLLAQGPVFSVVYLLFRSPTVAGGPNRLLTHDLFGVPLGAHWLSGAGLFGAPGAVFLGVLAVLGAACWLSARVGRRMSAAMAPATSTPSGVARARDMPGVPGVPGIPGWLGKALPYLTVVIAAFAPLAAVIYLITSTTWSAAERLLFARRFGGRQAGNSLAAGRVTP